MLRFYLVGRGENGRVLKRIMTEIYLHLKDNYFRMDFQEEGGETRGQKTS